jgi:cobalamin-dependent methionine synthase I
MATVKGDVPISARTSSASSSSATTIVVDLGVMVPAGKILRRCATNRGRSASRPYHPCSTRCVLSRPRWSARVSTAADGGATTSRVHRGEDPSPRTVHADASARVAVVVTSCRRRRGPPCRRRSRGIRPCRITHARGEETKRWLLGAARAGARVDWSGSYLPQRPRFLGASTISLLDRGAVRLHRLVAILRYLGADRQHRDIDDAKYGPAARGVFRRAVAMLAPPGGVLLAPPRLALPANADGDDILPLRR